MTTKKLFITLGLALASVVVLPTARADEYDQASKLTFNKSIQIPGHVMPAGTYWFVLANVTYPRRCPGFQHLTDPLLAGKRHNHNCGAY